LFIVRNGGVFCLICISYCWYWGGWNHVIKIRFLVFFYLIRRVCRGMYWYLVSFFWIIFLGFASILLSLLFMWGLIICISLRRLVYGRNRESDATSHRLNGLRIRRIRPILRTFRFMRPSNRRHNVPFNSSCVGGIEHGLGRLFHILREIGRFSLKSMRLFNCW
jgi:hypothetical protein